VAISSVAVPEQLEPVQEKLIGISKDLLFPSETDSEFTVFCYPFQGSLPSEDEFSTLVGLKCRRCSLEELFARRALQRAEWKEFREQLAGLFGEAAVWIAAVGSAEARVYIGGVHAGFVAGLVATEITSD